MLVVAAVFALAGIAAGGWLQARVPADTFGPWLFDGLAVLGWR